MALELPVAAGGLPGELGSTAKQLGREKWASDHGDGYIGGGLDLAVIGEKAQDPERKGLAILVDVDSVLAAGPTGIVQQAREADQATH